MPTYDYKCKNCGLEFEKFQSMSSAPIRKCPKCGKNTVERLIGAGAGLIFKGSGFYITDYRDAAYADKAKAESGESKGESKSDGQAKEAKPAAEAKATGDSAKTPESPKAESAKSEPSKKSDSSANTSRSSGASSKSEKSGRKKT